MKRISWFGAMGLFGTMAALGAACGSSVDAASSGAGGAGATTSAASGHGGDTQASSGSNQGGSGPTTSGTSTGGGPCGGCLPGRVCDPSLGCVECAGDGDCTDPTRPTCVLGRCSACGTTADCPSNEVCSPGFHACVPPCTTSTDCNGFAAICSNGTCVECAQASDCDPTHPLCDATTGNCVACTSSADCTDPAAPKCNPARGSCAACIVTPDCPPGSVCAGGECAPACASNADCGGPGGQSVCETGTGLCVECLASTDCIDPTQPICSSDRCVECATAADCADPGQPLCSSRGSCVECVTDGDCPAGQTCSGFQGQCH